MAWLAVTDDGIEHIYTLEPYRYEGKLIPDPLYDDHDIVLPKGSIKKLIGIDLKSGDNPVEYD